MKTSSSPTKTFVQILGLIALVCWGGMFAYVGWKTRDTARTASAWPRTEATILSAVAAPASDSFQVQYSYEVLGKRYMSASVLPKFAWTAQVTGNDSKVALIVRDEAGSTHFLDVEAGDVVPVSYNPAEPDKAYLLPYSPSMLPFIGFGVISIVLGLAGLGKLLCR